MRPPLPEKPRRALIFSNCATGDNYANIIREAWRADLEAMAVGSAVVVCDSQGCGPMVSPENFHSLRRLNFGFRTLVQSITIENLISQIARYEAAAAAAVCQLVRTEADLHPTVDAIVRLYEEALAGHKNSPADMEAELRAAGKYLQWISPVIKPAPKDPNRPSLMAEP